MGSYKAQLKRMEKSSPRKLSCMRVRKTNIFRSYQGGPRSIIRLDPFQRNFRGEIDESSWLMRDLWDTQDIQGKGKGLVTRPNKLTSIGIKKLVNRAIWAQGLRRN